MVTRARVRQWLEERFFLRIHMTLILAGTFLAGVVATRVLMQGGVNVLAVRYAIAVCVAYLVFLVLVKLWLLYVGSGGYSPADLAGDVADTFDLAVRDAATNAPAPRLAGAPAPRVSSGRSSGFWSFDLGGDPDDIVFMLVLIAVVLLIGGIAVYFIYTAPALLSEAAFEAVLAASIARRAKRSEGAGWLGAVTRATVWPFLGVLVLSTVLGWLAQRRCPEALRLRDAVECVKR